MATTRQTLKQYFRQYATPTQAQFAELIDAFVHKDEDSLTQSKIDGLVADLEGKASTSQVNTMVASKVTEIVTDPQFAAAPTAHSHVAADVEGLSAFITRVTNFLDSADVSDTTINRWKGIETFLTGITDQETLAGLLLQLKAEILAQVPQPQTGDYLKQVSSLYNTRANEYDIVQIVNPENRTNPIYRPGAMFELRPCRNYDDNAYPDYSEKILTITAYDNLSPRYNHLLIPADDVWITSSDRGSDSAWCDFESFFKDLIVPMPGVYGHCNENYAITQINYESKDIPNPLLYRRYADGWYGPAPQLLSVGSQLLKFPSYHSVECAKVEEIDTTRFRINGTWYNFSDATTINLTPKCYSCEGSIIVTYENDVNGLAMLFRITSLHVIPAVGYLHNYQTDDEYQYFWQPIVTSPSVS